MAKVNFSNIPPLTEKIFYRFKELIYSETGISMRDSKRILVSNRLRKRINALNLTSYDEYYRFLTRTDEGAKELPNFIDAISTNETYFYRGDNQFEVLKKLILPELCQKKSKIRIWSAGCSTGEEPYSTCIVILETAGAHWKGKVEVVATDINTEVIEKAKEGIYSGRTLKFVPKALMTRYFESVGNEKFRVRKMVREIVNFKCHNLLKDEPPGFGFNIIFCRNVMIYFNKSTQKFIVDGSFNKALARDGYLFIGHSESLRGISEYFKYARIHKAPIYVPTQKKSGEEVK